MHIVLFEGPDKCGKSTALKSLSEVISCGMCDDFTGKIDAITLGKPFSCDEMYGRKLEDKVIVRRLSMVAENILQIMRMEPDLDTDIVLLIDRLHISEIVYSELFARKTDEKLTTAIDEMLNHKNTFLAEFRPVDSKKRADKLEKAGLGLIDGLTKEEWLTSARAFEEQCKESSIRNKGIYTFENVQDLRTDVADWINNG